VLQVILAALETASFFTGVALIAAGLIFARDRRRLIRMNTAGVGLVGLAFLLTFLIIILSYGAGERLAPP
jgi:hypothetical protein